MFLLIFLKILRGPNLLIKLKIKTGKRRQAYLLSYLNFLRVGVEPTPYLFLLEDDCSILIIECLRSSTYLRHRFILLRKRNKQQAYWDLNPSPKTFNRWSNAYLRQLSYFLYNLLIHNILCVLSERCVKKKRKSKRRKETVYIVLPTELPQFSLRTGLEPVTHGVISEVTLFYGIFLIFN